MAPINGAYPVNNGSGGNEGKKYLIDGNKCTDGNISYMNKEGYFNSVNEIDPAFDNYIGNNEVKEYAHRAGTKFLSLADYKYKKDDKYFYNACMCKDGNSPIEADDFEIPVENLYVQYIPDGEDILPSRAERFGAVVVNNFGYPVGNDHRGFSTKDIAASVFNLKLDSDVKEKPFQMDYTETALATYYYDGLDEKGDFDADRIDGEIPVLGMKMFHKKLADEYQNGNIDFLRSVQDGADLILDKFVTDNDSFFQKEVGINMGVPREELDRSLVEQMDKPEIAPLPTIAAPEESDDPQYQPEPRGNK